MKKRLFIATALMTVMMTNAQEVCSFDAEKLGITSDGIELKSGTVVGETQSVVCSLGADDIYYVNANAAVTITATVNDNIISGGFIGSTNPKDADGGVPSKTLKEPVMGSFLVFEAKSDGFLYVPIKASSNKAFTVFEDGTAVSFTYAAIGNELTDLGSFYQFTLPFTVKNGQNVVQDPIEWAEQEYLKATAPAKYAARWYEDAQGNKLWNSMKVVSAGVIKFPVRKDSKYIVNANGAKTNAGGFYFDTTGDADVIVDNTKILGVGVGPQIKQNIVFADNAVKALCVANWDTDGDGELSIDEATAVKDLGMVFKDNVTITSFNELLYFTGLTSIASDAFTFCSNLSSLIIPNGVTSIDSKAFYYCSSLTSIIIPNNVTSINDGAFKGCRSLSIVTIPKNVAFIGYNPFEDCSSLANIQVESGNTIYDSRENCNAIIETSSNTLVSGCINTTIPDGIITIAEGAFSLCNGLTSISLPNSVTTIGDNAFYYCTALSSISIPKSVTSIYHNPFSFCGGLTSITVESGNNLFDSRDGCNAIIEKESNKLVLGCKNTIIPNSVSSIGDFAFSGCTGLTSMNIPVGVTSIGQNAFLECSGLTTVTIPNRVTFIGIGAFSWCAELSSVNIPNSVTYIGHHAFYQCNKLASITSWISNPFDINENDFDDIVYQNTTLYIPYGSKAKYEAAEGWNKFSNKKESIGEVDPNDIISFVDNTVKALCVANWDTDGDEELSKAEAAGVTNLGTVFKGNTTITSFNELAYFTGLLSIDDNSFYGCRSLTSVIIPNSVTSIANTAFRECIELTSVTIGNSISTIGKGAFWGCSSLSSINVASGNTIYDSRNNCNAIIESSSNTLIIGCKNTVIPSTVISIGSHAFCDCRLMTSVTIPNSVTSIGDNAFLNCSSLTSITIPNSVMSIGDGAFVYCISLTSVTIPSSVTSIGEGVFCMCDGLTSIIVESGNTYYDSRNNCNAIIETSSNTLIMGCKNTVVPNNVTSIGNCAFKDCSGLTSITLPNNVSSIGNYAFGNCIGLTSVTIPSSVTSIGNSAFEDCWRLTSIEIPSSVTSIENSAFANCSGLTSIEIPNSVTSIGYGSFLGCSGLTSVTIPNSVIIINHWAFAWCSSLSSVTIPNSVKSIGENVFKNCSGLTSVTSMLSEPFNINEIVFDDIVYQNATLNIPYGSKAKYEAAEGWNKFCKKTEKTLVARTINVETAGTLPALIGDEKYQIEELTLAGELNGTDIHFIRDMAGVNMDLMEDSEFMPFPNARTKGELRVLDLSDANIVEGGRDYYKMLTSSVQHSFDDYKYTKSNTISDCMFNLCWKLEELTLPRSVTTIESEAFGYSSGLTSVTIPNSVTDIGDGAFDGCDGLITIISKINNPFEISDETFPNYDVELIVPAGTKSAYLSTAGWNKFTNITEAPSTKRTINVEEAGTLPALIGDDKYQIEELTLTGELNGTDFKFIREMAGDAVSYMDTPDEAEVYHDPTEGMLRSLDISNAIIVEGGDPYNYITYGTDVTFLRTADNKITAGLFDRTNLKSILLPSNVTSIEGKEYFGYKMASMYIGAFPECLTSLEIPVTVESIGNYAFYGCTGLTEVIVNRSAPITMEECSFPTHASVILYVPNGSKATFEAADYWKEFKQIKEFVKDNEVTYTIEDNNTITATAVNDPKEKDVVIPESVMIDGEPHIVTAIGDEAFKDNTSLTLVCIPETIEDIGEEAFAGCNSLMAIYCYSDDPIALGNAKATVRTRNSGDISALTVFTEVDMSNCILYVPMNCGDKYRNAKGWSDFQNIVEMKSNMLGDANSDANVDSKDIDATVNYIMEGKTEDFIFKNADTNADKKVNVVDIVKFNNLFGK